MIKNHKVFSDVSVSDWYYETVHSLAARNIIVGVGDSQFAPDRYITREEMATILYRCLVNKEMMLESTYNETI